MGWFAPENKKSLPGRIQRVAVITAPFGAALQDFLRLSQDRGWPGEIRIYPSLVQGQGAEDNLVSAVQEAALEGWAQVLVLIRGGGSLEDLWCFNSEQLAQNLYELELPVLTGIGHETDVTIADLVADVRAATPSHAAQLLWPERNQLLQQLDELQGQLVSSCHRLYSFKLQQLQELQRALHWLSPWQNLQRHLALLQEQSHALVSRSQRLVQHKKRLLRDLAFRLNRTFSFKDWRYRMSSLQELQHRLLTAADRHVQNWENKYQEVNIRLARHNPLLPLEQGYSLVRVAKDHSLLRRAQQVQPGDLLLISTREDVLQARVVASDSAQSDSACNASQRLPGPQDLPEA